jgi:hypothetical protein
MKRIILGLVSVFLMSACEESSVENQELSEGSVTGQISAQESGIKYADYNVPDALPWGPSGVFSVRDGYVIPDNVTKKLVTLDENFKVTGGIAVGDKAVGITSVVQDTSGLAALDSAAVMPKLLHISPDGFIRSGEIPKMHQTPPSGLMRDDLGLLLEYSGGEYLYRISENDGTVALSQVEGYTLNGKLCYAEKPEAAYFHGRRLHIGDKVVIISVPNHLGSVQILGSDTDGNLQVLVEDVSLSPVITVEQTIWSIATSGEVLSISKVPLDQMAFAIAHPVTLSKQGKAVTLVPKDNALQLWKLAPSHPGIIAARAVMPLPGEAKKVTDSVSVSSHPLFVYSGSCLTTLQMLANINEYLNTAAYMQSANIDNSSSCQVRIKPAYLGGPGTYTSVSYDWGGFDTPSAFVSAMSLGKKGWKYGKQYSIRAFLFIRSGLFRFRIQSVGFYGKV